MQGVKTTEPDLPSDAQWQQTDSHPEILFKRKNTLSDSGHTLERVAQRSCRVSIIGDLQILTGHSLEQGLDQMDSGDAFSLSCILSL